MAIGGGDKDHESTTGVILGRLGTQRRKGMERHGQKGKVIGPYSMCIMMIGLSSERYLLSARTAAKHVSYHTVARSGSLWCAYRPPHILNLTAYLLSLSVDPRSAVTSLSYSMNDKSSVKPSGKYRYNPPIRYLR